MTFAEKLILARKRLGLSQEALAEALGVFRQAVSKWETGEALGGLGILILGVIAKIISGQMVRSYAQSMAPWGFAQQGGFTVESGSLDGLFGPPQVFNPVGAVATVMIVLGALGMVMGIVLALWLKRKQGK